VADATQLHQVVLNLCINARDAMSAGGTLTISAENIVLDDSFVATHPQSRSGHCVVISVTDTGCGIPPNHLDKIFEPFFTTKDHGKGTGLGLSTSLAIVKAHSGFIDVHSEVGRGTTFKVYLPAKPSVAVGSEQEAAPIAMGNQELILIVDDEAAVRNIARATLEAYNYRVITAKDGADGIAMFAKNKDEVRLILSDNNMPVMDGAAMLRVIVKIKPDAKVICVSGMGPADDNNLDSMAASVLPKPFTAEQLVRAVTNALKGSADSARQHAGGLNS
jgi:CheY-like chemotaxis protein